METRYILKIAVSVTALILGLSSGVVTGNPVLAGLAAAAGFAVFRSAERTSNLYGKTVGAKILNSFVPNLIEFSVLASAVFFMPEASPVVDLVPVLATAVTGFAVISQIETEKKLNARLQNMIGRPERVLGLSVVFAAGFFNLYLMLYGLTVLSVLILADVVLAVYRFLNE